MSPRLALFLIIQGIPNLIQLKASWNQSKSNTDFIEVIRKA
jgi:hypothetical protein